MDDFEHGLDSTGKAESPESDDIQLTMEDNGDDQGTVSLTLDANGQYQFRADTGQGAVTYRVVQVSPSDDNQSHLMTGLPTSQAVLHGLINGNSPTEDAVGGQQPQQTRFYIPASALSSQLDSGQNLETRGTAINPSAGPFYVMMAPSDALQAGQRTIVPRTQVITVKKCDMAGRGTRDDRRRTTHNEVERRRRDKINGWIMQLGKLIPDCAAEQSKQGDSKGGILAKACEYIGELQVDNKETEESVRIVEQVKVDIEVLRQEYENLKQENELLRVHIQQNGIELSDLQTQGL